MADPRHVDVLRQGVAAWNAWRRREPKVEPDLSTLSLARRRLAGIDLRFTSLENSDLRGTDLGGARLRGAVLYNADLRRTRLPEADLRDAMLDRAIADRAVLTRARLDDASLQRTTLDEADLTDASLRRANLHEASLGRARLGAARFDGANLDGANLSQCDASACSFAGARMPNMRFANARLRGVKLAGRMLAGGVFWRSDLSGADLRDTACHNVEFAEGSFVGTDFRGATLDTVEFRHADLRRARLDGAFLDNASLVGANVEGADFEGACVYGISAWDLQGTPRRQNDLVITPHGEQPLTVDDLEVAQFVYFVCNNPKIRRFMNVFTEKNVLILGRFSPPERKAVLDGLRVRLRQHGFVPIVFDFDGPQDKDLTETVQTLAGLSMFVIVDVTQPKSTPLEMEATVKQFKLPFVPIIDVSVDERPFAMLRDLQQSFHWVLPVFGYDGPAELWRMLEPAVLQPARRKHAELREQKAGQSIAMLRAADFAPRSRGRRR